MIFTEKTISQTEKYHGILVNIRLDEIELPNGKPALREVCEHCGGVGILPIDDEGNVILVRQHRYAYHVDILEIPAGKMDHGAEDHKACGIRELKEETALQELLGKARGIVVHKKPSFSVCISSI